MEYLTGEDAHSAQFGDCFFVFNQLTHLISVAKAGTWCNLNLGTTNGVTFNCRNSM